MGSADADAAGKHHDAAPEAVDEDHGEHGEDEVNCAGDDDVEKYIVGSVAGATIDFGGVVEEDVDAGPLLEHSEGDANKEDLAECGKKKLAPGGLGEGGVGTLRGFDAGNFSAGVGGATNAFENRAGITVATDAAEPAGALGNEEGGDGEDEGRRGDSGEHPSPSVLHVP